MVWGVRVQTSRHGDHGRHVDIVQSGLHVLKVPESLGFRLLGFLADYYDKPVWETWAVGALLNLSVVGV
jgi:hypothetical protein